MMKLTRKAVALAGAAAMMASCNHMKQIKHMPYPETQRTDVVDDYFGTKVADPYRWLEDDNSEATAAVTQDYLSQIPFRDAIRGRLTQLWNYPKEGIPAKHGDAWYYFYNDGLQNQSVLYRTTAPGAQGEVFLNPNTLSDDGTVALSSVAFSKDGKYCACAVAESGSDWVEIRVMNTADRTFTTDKINWVKFSGAEWAPDSKGFYYSAYDAPEKGVFSSQNQFQKVYYHRLGTPQSADKLIYMDAEHPLRYFSAWPSKDGKWLFISASEGTSGTEILYKKVSEPKFRTLLPGFDADYALTAHSGQGVVRNRGDVKQTSDVTMRQRILRTFDMTDSPRWDFRGYKPDIVVIKLGTNDCSTGITPSEAAFGKAFRELYGALREHYGSVPILYVIPDGAEAFYPYMQSVMAGLEDGDLHCVMHFTGITNQDGDLGAGYHPNHRGHRKFAAAVIPYISTIMGWEMPMEVIQ